ELVPAMDVELETSDGVTVKLSLDEFMPFPPVITTDFTPFGWFDGIFRDDKYEQSWEPIFQSFEIPFEAFKQQDPSFAKDNISQLKLHFKSHPGKIYLEEIGVR